MNHLFMLPQLKRFILPHGCHFE